ncbi:MAG: ParB N-terminal domain-containing protein [Chloroflexi bacterium]|nr:ParB N-terminal domain-containing protein [Chloroflexota bacterium]
MPLVYNVPSTSAQFGTHHVTLRVVHLDDVLLHEHTERQRVKQLVERIQLDQLLKNPPIVVPHADKYILLDGATRVTALKQLGYPDVVVQVVDYAMPGLALETWNHLLMGLPVSEFLDALRQIQGLQIVSTTQDDAEDALNRRTSVATLVLPDGQVFSLRLIDAQTLTTQIDLLNQVVAAYEGRGELQRIAHADVLKLAQSKLAWNALVIFPRYQPGDIRALALNGHKLPTGITRHIIPGRAMRINIPVELLQSADSLEQKNAQLGEWMQAKLRERRVRYYHEPVFLFDE